MQIKNNFSYVELTLLYQFFPYFCPLIILSFQNEEEKYQLLAKLYHGDLYHMDLDKEEEKKLLSDYIRQFQLQKIEAEIKAVTNAEELSRLFKERDNWEHFSL